MPQTKCYQCGKYFDTDINENSFYCRRIQDTGDSTIICSLSCLCAHVWELREREPKLSRSKTIND